MFVSSSVAKDNSRLRAYNVCVTFYSIQKEKCTRLRDYPIALLIGYAGSLWKPAKVIISQIEKDSTLLPKDVIAFRQAIYRQKRKTMPILPKYLLETIEPLQDFDLQSVNDEKMFHVVDADSKSVMFTTASNLELMCQDVHL